jgi:hypothetical protein
MEATFAMVGFTAFHSDTYRQARGRAGTSTMTLFSRGAAGWFRTMARRR